MAGRDIRSSAEEAARGLDTLAASLDRVDQSAGRVVLAVRGGDVQPASGLERVNANDGATVGGSQGIRSADGSRASSLELFEKKILTALDRAQQAEATRRREEKRKTELLAAELRGVRQALAAKFNRELEDRSSLAL